MTDYSDVPQVNALYQEQQQVESAIGMLDDGGTVTDFTVAPPVVPPDPDHPPSGPTPMPVRIMLAEPASPELVAQARSELVQRSAAITKELEGLGVTDIPPSKASAARSG
jgi:hypothetical protein